MSDTAARQASASSALAVDLPADSRIVSSYAAADLADAYAIRLPVGASRDPETLARFVFSQRPAWVRGLMAVRDAAVAGLGLKTARQLERSQATDKTPRIAFFRIYETSGREIILGEDDKHLDFRVSVLCRDAPPAGAPASLVVSTVVHCHNRLGRAYIATIAPFHRLVVRALLRRAAKVGWPSDATDGVVGRVG